MKLIYRIFFVLVFIVILGAIIAFARGYRVDLEKQNLTSTGIISVSAFPKASKVYVNGQLKGVSDINLTFPPGYYEVEVKKDGYTSWGKSVRLKGELVLTLDVLLYPLNPSLSALTNLAVVLAIPVTQSDKVILFSENEDETKDGIYIYESGKTPLSFFTPLKQILLKKNLTDSVGELSLKDTSVEVSPDTEEAIFTFNTLTGPASYLLSLGGENLTFFDISSSRETITQAWFGQREEANQKILEAYPSDIAKVASDSFRVIEFSPDETKLLYAAKKSTVLPKTIQPELIAVNQTPEVRNIQANSLYIYDKKEDRNYQISSTNFQPPTSISWYSDSKHLVINEGQKISFIDYDGENKQTVFSGSFEDSFFKVASDGRILMLPSLNPDANRFPDLYAVGIR